MRKVMFAFACGLLAACTSIPPLPPADTAEYVKIYDAEPPYSQPLGPVSVTTCNEGKEIATRRLLADVRRMGGNGITQLKCSDSGMTFYCWSSAKCDALALNVLPPPPPPPPVVKRTPPKKRSGTR